MGCASTHQEQIIETSFINEFICSFCESFDLQGITADVYMQVVNRLPWGDLNMRYMDKSSEPPTHYTSESCSIMETQAMKLPVQLLCWC